MLRRGRIRRLLLGLLALSLAAFAASLARARVSAAQTEPTTAGPKAKPVTWACPWEVRQGGDGEPGALHRKLKEFKPPSEAKILILLETEYSGFGRRLRDVLDGLKFPYRAEVLGTPPPFEGRWGSGIGGLLQGGNSPS